MSACCLGVKFEEEAGLEERIGAAEAAWVGGILRTAGAASFGGRLGAAETASLGRGFGGEAPSF